MIGCSLLFLLLRTINSEMLRGITEKHVIIEAKMVIEEAELKDGVLETTVELVLALIDGHISTHSLEVLLMPTEQQQHPFTDIRFASEEQQTIGNYRSVTKANGRIVATKERMHLKTACPLSKRFPFDGRTCELRLFSARQQLSSLELRFHPRADPVYLSPTITTARFFLEKVTPVSCSFDTIYAISKDSLLTARHSCLSIRISFTSPLLSSIIRYFIPPLLAPLMAWFGLFTPRNNLHLRFFIIAISILIMFLSCLTAHSTPTTPYLSPLDIWYILIASILLLFIVQYFIIACLVGSSDKLHNMSLGEGGYPVRRKSRERRERMEARKRAMSPSNNCNSTYDKEKGSCYSSIINDALIRSSDRQSLNAVRVDLTSRFAFPILTLFLILFFFFFQLFVYAE